MNFVIIDPFIKKGRVILWEIRGMGINTKLKHYSIDSLENIEEFFLESIRVILCYFQPKDSIWVCHSFSAYLMFKFVTRNPAMTKEHVKEIILLSCIGITVAEEDYKARIESCSDLFHTVISKIGWTFNWTYKTLLRTICFCFKDYFISNYLKALAINEKNR